VSKKKDKQAFDDQTLGRLLEAAYVVQEHNTAQKLKAERPSDRTRKDDGLQQPESAAKQTPIEPSNAATVRPDAKNDYTPTLAQIVETQGLIRDRRPDLENALALVAERVALITKSSGAAIGILDGKTVRYRAATGSSSLPRGTEVPKEEAVCFSCFRSSQPFRCPEVNPAAPVDAERCHRRGIQSLIAVPVYHDREIAGALEVYFAKAHAFSETDVHTCQLMAVLITEVLARDSQHERKESLAAERASMLEALEKLRPNLSALLEASTTKDATTKSSDHAAVAAIAAAQTFLCRKCGHELVGEEQFCGKCGTPRISDNAPPTLQKRTVRPPANGAGQQTPASTSPEHDLAREPDHDIEDGHDDIHPAPPVPDEGDVLRLLAAAQAKLWAQEASDPNVGLEGHAPEEGTQAPPSQPEATSALEEDDSKILAKATATTKTDGALTWSSAAKAKEFLEQLAASRNRSAFARLWNARRADIYLAVAIILMVGVVRWGISSSHSVNATGAAGASHRKPDPNADLSVFDRLLIGLGVAEAPDPPEHKGRPEIQVWVDVQTALYYCPGADLYGNTPKGKFTTQRDAQLDQYEPAYRKACD
jgi:GAF domain-containing protein